MRTFIILTTVTILMKFGATAQTETQNDSNTVFTFVDHMPSYIGGDTKLSEFLTANFEFSKNLKLEKSYYRLTIERSGEVVTVNKLLGDSITAEKLIEVLKKTSGQWKNGTHNGHKVIVNRIVSVVLSKNNIVAKVVDPEYIKK